MYIHILYIYSSFKGKVEIVNTNPSYGGHQSDIENTI